MLHIFSHTDEDFSDKIAGILDRDTETTRQIEEVVRRIIARIRTEGDLGLLAITKELDRVEADTIDGLEFHQSDLDAALRNLDQASKAALEVAAARIKEYHEHEVLASWSVTQADGTVLGQKISPLDRVGLYVPGGKASYPSSVLMTAIPAKVAGVKEVIMTVPTPDGEINQMVLAAAKLAGIDRVFGIGGAQAVAALAYGTESIPAVDKIVGPGNIYVATAKKMVFGKVGIDMIAGPSEVVVICDESANPDWVAMDLFAQAEHDELAQSIAITDSVQMVEAIQRSISKLLPTMERKEIIAESLESFGAIVLVESMDMATELSDRIAPEHLELMVADAESLLAKVNHAGAIFVGRHSAESLGDYCAGPSHVLPTAGTARFSSPLGVYDYQKRSSVINMSEKGAKNIAGVASVLARNEGLTAHARSAELRLEDDPKPAL